MNIKHTDKQIKETILILYRTEALNEVLLEVQEKLILCKTERELELVGEIYESLLEKLVTSLKNVEEVLNPKNT